MTPGMRIFLMPGRVRRIDGQMQRPLGLGLFASADFAA